MIIWGLTDGSAGMASQVRGVGEALTTRLNNSPFPLGEGLGVRENISSSKPSPHTSPKGRGSFELKQARRMWPFCLLPGTWWKNTLLLKTSSSDALKKPWPDLLITSGRRSVAFALAIKDASGGHTKLVHLQTPKAPLNLFDLVVPMEHDDASGDNIFPTFAALHHVTNEKLSQAAYAFQDELDTYQSPRLAFFIGGSTNKYKLTRRRMRTLIQTMQSAVSQHQGSVFVSVSRRTGEENTNALLSTLGHHDRIWTYTGGERNPYLAWLAAADTLIVTNDSVSMMSEALATGKPLYILNLPEHTDTKPARFARQLISRGMARPFSLPLIPYNAKPYTEVPQVVDEIVDKLLVK